MQVKKIFILPILLVLTMQLMSFSAAAQMQQQNELYIETGYTDWIDEIVFSPDGKMFATSQNGWGNLIKLWQTETGIELGEFSRTFDDLKQINLSPDSEISQFVWEIIFSSDSKTLIFVESLTMPNDNKSQFFVRKLDVGTGKEIGSKIKLPINAGFECVRLLDKNGWKVAVKNTTKTTWFDTASGKSVSENLDIKCGNNEDFDEASFELESMNRNRDVLKKYGLPSLMDEGPNIITISPNSKTLVAGFGIPLGAQDEEWFVVEVWNLETRRLINSNSGTSKTKTELEVSTKKNFFAFGEWSGTTGIFDITKNVVRVLPSIAANNENQGNDVDPEDMSIGKNIAKLTDVKISPDGKIVAVSTWYSAIALWNLTDDKVTTLNVPGQNVSTFEFSPNGKFVAVNENLLINIETEKDSKLRKPIPKWAKETNTTTKTFSNNIILQADGVAINVLKSSDKQLLATVYTFANNNYQYDWVVATPEGRFDTNKSLENIEGLHWIVNNEILNPLPLDIFMRQYYEPNLLQRVLKCNEENTCDTEFKPLPSISEINRVQPKVAIKEINLVKNADGLADVTVEVESVSEDVGNSAADRTKKKKLISGAFDLRLFRDGQLVGVSTPKNKLEPFIKNAPSLIEQNRKYFAETGKLTNTPEDAQWRKANDIFALVGAENVKRISPEKLEYTFRNIRLPKGRTSVDFTAYAFNSDKVKSTTTDPFKFTIPNTIATSDKKGRAFVVSIGVNVSETSGFDLQYAVNDARKMQEIIGSRLKAETDKYSEVIQIPLISDYKTDKFAAVNTARKEIIRGVFSLLSGNKGEVSDEVLKQIPGFETIKAVEPEDTLIISFSGHGYADTSGIFYLLPNDIGKNFSVKTDSLNKTISSDELSLWIQDITANEMIMIIDACYSASAVGADFKPGPMGSRGLGQLAYDKDMKILSATQANNVALELGSLEQGLLSYAILQDGVKDKRADANNDKKLLSTELLEYAEKRVPELYQEIKEGKHSVIINGKRVKGLQARAETFGSDKTNKSSLNLQQPKIFDFKRRKADNTLFSLP